MQTLLCPLVCPVVVAEQLFLMLILFSYVGVAVAFVDLIVVMKCQCTVLSISILM